MELGQAEAEGVAVYSGTERLRWWIEEGQHDDRKHGRRGLWSQPEDLTRFKESFDRQSPRLDAPCGERVVIGCDFGSTTAKAVCLTPEGEIVRSCDSLEQGEPDRGCQGPVPKVREITGGAEVAALAITGYARTCCAI